ncbi:hypothetical protein FACS1894172_09440 [Spirochaetia bacterium]|nr:hypothetical protein FACS1894172_09440 [Spirochaetia bacterium]
MTDDQELRARALEIAVAIMGPRPDLYSAVAEKIEQYICAGKPAEPRGVDQAR